MTDVDVTYQQKVSDYLVTFQGYYGGLLTMSEYSLKGMIVSAENELLDSLNAQSY